MKSRNTTATGVLAFARIALPSLLVVLTLILSNALMLVPFDQGYVVLAALAAMLAALIVKPTFEMPEFETAAGSHTRIFSFVLAAWTTLVVLLLVFGYASKVSEHFSRRAFFAWFLLGGVGLVVGRYWLELLTRRVMSRPEMARNVAIAGINDVSIRLAKGFSDHPQHGFHVHGYFEDRGLDRIVPEFDGNVLGGLSDLPEYVKTHAIDVVFIALPIKHIQRVLDMLDQLHDTTVSIYFLPDVFVFDLIQSRVQMICGLPAIALCETPFFGYQGLLKRSLDLSLSVLGLVVLSPLLLLVAGLIKLTSRGSVIFRQHRYGLDGREIVVYKFRTMRVSENGAKVVQAQRDDARLTPIGGFLRRTSIDELPQLFNVVQGRMSLVGPRPHAVAHNEEYRQLIKGYMFRHKVLPGITGWAQVNGFRGGTERLEDMQGRVDHDLNYLRNWSVGFDLKILLLTVVRLLSSKKAY